MKGGGGGGGGGGGKRRWRCLVVGVLGLVVLSMLVPLAFLLGRFHSTYAAGNDLCDDRLRSLVRVCLGFSVDFILFFFVRGVSDVLVAFAVLLMCVELIELFGVEEFLDHFVM